MERRSTRSNSIPHDGTDAQFWAAQPNPRQIERGHAEAVALTRVATRTTMEVVVEGDVRSLEVNPVREDTLPNEVRGLTSAPTQEPQPPGEGQRDLQMRTPAAEEGASFSTGDISSEANTTKQDGAEPLTNTQQYRENTRPLHNWNTNGYGYSGTTVSQRTGRISGRWVGGCLTKLSITTRQFYSFVGSRQQVTGKQTNATGMGGTRYDE